MPEALADDASELHRIPKTEARARTGGDGVSVGRIRGHEPIVSLGDDAVDQINRLSADATGALVQDDVIDTEARDDLAHVTQEGVLAHDRDVVDHVPETEAQHSGIREDPRESDATTWRHRSHVKELGEGPPGITLEDGHRTRRGTEAGLVLVVDCRIAVNGGKRQLGVLHGVHLAAQDTAGPGVLVETACDRQERYVALVAKIMCEVEARVACCQVHETCLVGDTIGTHDESVASGLDTVDRGVVENLDLHAVPAGEFDELLGECVVIHRVTAGTPK